MCSLFLVCLFSIEDDAEVGDMCNLSGRGLQASGDAEKVKNILSKLQGRHVKSNQVVLGSQVNYQNPRIYITPTVGVPEERDNREESNLTGE